MINKISELSKHFNIPYTTLRDWERAKNNWRHKFLEKIDKYLLLEKKAIKKFLNKFTDEETQKLLEVIFKNNNITSYSFIDIKKEIIADKDLEEEDKVILLDKLKNFCDFEIYAFVELMQEKNNKKLDLKKLKAYFNKKSKDIKGNQLND